MISKPKKTKCISNLCLRFGNFDGLCDKCKKSVTRVKQVSDKRAKENKEYSKLRKDFLEKNPLCEINGKKATEVHHTYSGSKRSKHYLDTSTWMAVSREGHNYIHENPIIAKQNGWLK